MILSLGGSMQPKLPFSLFTMVARARAMRRAPTRSEALLWAALRGRALGVKFRWQHPIGRFIVDFYCAEYRLAVEVDGRVHEVGRVALHDAWRERELAYAGVRVVRVLALDVERDVSAVVRRLRRALHR